MKFIATTPYPITIGDSIPRLQQLLSASNYSKNAVLVDSNTREHCLPRLLEGLPADTPIIEVPAGEVHKNLESCRHIWTEMMVQGLDRHSLLINLGGGVVGDMGGFCAATYLRGIDFVQIPTTLLAQVDASVGGKLGIDFNGIKNSIGVFQYPKAVVIDPVFLQTLPFLEMRSGFAEMLKHALIADAGLWDFLKQVSGFNLLDWPGQIERSVRIKHGIVEADPHEGGLRKTLNFGHTIGHAVEGFFLKNGKPIPHGEAVAIGIICESWLSVGEGKLDAADLVEIEEVIRKWYPPHVFGEKDFPELFHFMQKDKKNTAGAIHFTLLNSIGEAAINKVCGREAIEESLRYYLAKA